MIKDERYAAEITISPGAPEEYIQKGLANARRSLVERIFEDGLYNHRTYMFRIEEIPPHPMELQAASYFGGDYPSYVVKLHIQEVQPRSYHYPPVIADYDDLFAPYIPKSSSLRNKIAFKLYRWVRND